MSFLHRQSNSDSKYPAVVGGSRSCDRGGKLSLWLGGLNGFWLQTFKNNRLKTIGHPSQTVTSSIAESNQHFLFTPSPVKSTSFRSTSLASSSEVPAVLVLQTKDLKMCFFWISHQVISKQRTHEWLIGRQQRLHQVTTSSSDHPSRCRRP